MTRMVAGHARAALLAVVCLIASPVWSVFADVPCRIPPGTWCEIPGTRMADVFPSREGHPGWGIIGPRAVTAAWGGAALDTKRNLLILTGGGHADYGGNEVYELDLGSMKWRRATEPSRMREVQPGEFVIDDSQAPVSSHTYAGLVYVPSIDRMFKFGGSYYRHGTSYDRHVYLYDPSSKTWARRAAAPRPGLTPAAAYDPKSGHVLVAVATGLMFYDPVSDAWKELPQRDGHLQINAATIDPETRRFVMISRHGDLLYYDIDNAGSRQRAPVKGDWGPRAGMSYHTPSKRLVLWSGSREVWTVDARSWNVCKFANPTGPAPTATDAKGREKTGGIYSRWQHVENFDIFVAYNSSSDNVWLYKLPGVSTEADRSGGLEKPCD